MQITITVPDKIVKDAISNALDGSIYEYFDSAALKAAKIPKIAAVTKQIFDDTKFRAQLTKTLQGIAEAEVEAMIYDEMFEIKMPLVDDLVAVCERAYIEREAEIEAEKEAAEVTRMVKTLERAGFKIVKG